MEGARRKAVRRRRDRVGDPGRGVVQIRLDERGEPLGRAPGAGRGALPVLARQHAPAQRRGRQQPDPQVQRGGQHLPLDAALEQRVLHLRTGQPGAHPGRGELPGGGLGQLPAAEVRHARIPDPAGRDGQVHRLERLLQRGLRVEGVDLPQVHVVRAEPLQGGVKGGQQVPARAVEAAVGVRDVARLRGDDQILARHQAADEPPEQVLGLPAPVHIGGVHQGAARVPEGLELFGGVVLVRVPAPGQGAEPDPGHA